MYKYIRLIPRALKECDSASEANILENVSIFNVVFKGSTVVARDKYSRLGEILDCDNVVVQFYGVCTHIYMLLYFTGTSKLMSVLLPAVFV